MNFPSQTVNLKYAGDLFKLILPSTLSRVSLKWLQELSQNLS